MAAYTKCITKCWSRNIQWKVGDKRTFDSLAEAEAHPHFEVITHDETDEEPEKPKRSRRKKEIEDGD